MTRRQRKDITASVRAEMARAAVQDIRDAAPWYRARLLRASGMASYGSDLALARRLGFGWVPPTWKRHEIYRPG